LDKFVFPVPAEDARPSSVLGGMPKWKATARQHLALTRAVADFILVDGQPVSVVEGIGFRRMVESLEPRYELPGRTFFQQVCLLLFVIHFLVPLC
jgi:hypothetical protein